MATTPVTLTAVTVPLVNPTSSSSGTCTRASLTAGLSAMIYARFTTLLCWWTAAISTIRCRAYYHNKVFTWPESNTVEVVPWELTWCVEPISSINTKSLYNQWGSFLMDVNKVCSIFHLPEWALWCLYITQTSIQIFQQRMHKLQGFPLLGHFAVPSATFTNVTRIWHDPIWITLEWIDVHS